jgi:3-deoxy-D-manno-octulosonic acid kinase
VSTPAVAHTRTGAVLFDAALHQHVPEEWFERQHWVDHDAVVDQALGRGTVLVVQRASETWVLRHYHRGGMIARFIDDHYLWLGLERTRAFREWRLLDALRKLELPVPWPGVGGRTNRGRDRSRRASRVTALPTVQTSLPPISPMRAHWLST